MVDNYVPVWYGFQILLPTTLGSRLSGSPQSSPVPSPPAGTNRPLPFHSFADTNRDLKKFCLSSQFYFEWFFSYSEGPSYIPLTLPHSYFLVTNFRVFSLMEKSALFNSFLFSVSILKKLVTESGPWNLNPKDENFLWFDILLFCSSPWSMWHHLKKKRKGR